MPQQPRLQSVDTTRALLEAAKAESDAKLAAQKALMTRAGVREGVQSDKERFLSELEMFAKKQAQEEAKAKQGAGKAKMPETMPNVQVQTNNPETKVRDTAVNAIRDAAAGGQANLQQMAQAGFQGASQGGGVNIAGQQFNVPDEITTRETRTTPTDVGFGNFVPMRSTGTRTEPNVLTAEGAARLQLAQHTAKVELFQNMMKDVNEDFTPQAAGILTEALSSGNFGLAKHIMGQSKTLSQKFMNVNLENARLQTRELREQIKLLGQQGRLQGMQADFIEKMMNQQYNSFDPGGFWGITPGGPVIAPGGGLGAGGAAGLGLPSWARLASGGGAANFGAFTDDLRKLTDFDTGELVDPSAGWAAQVQAARFGVAMAFDIDPEGKSWFSIGGKKTTSFVPMNDAMDAAIKVNDAVQRGGDMTDEEDAALQFLEDLKVGELSGDRFIWKGSGAPNYGLSQAMQNHLDLLLSYRALTGKLPDGYGMRGFLGRGVIERIERASQEAAALPQAGPQGPAAIRFARGTRRAALGAREEVVKGAQATARGVQAAGRAPGAITEQLGFLVGGLAGLPTSEILERSARARSLVDNLPRNVKDGVNSFIDSALPDSERLQQIIRFLTIQQQASSDTDRAKIQQLLDMIEG